MTRYELFLRLEHDCPYTKFSSRIPQAVTMHWCSSDKDVLEIYSPGVSESELDSELGVLVSNLKAKVTRRVSISDNKRIIVYHHKFSSMKENVNAVIEGCNCLEIQPTVYREGSEWYRIMGFSGRDVNALYFALSRFARVRTVSQGLESDQTVKNSIMIPSSSLLGKLTGKQRGALASAVGMGYYDIPARTSTGAIAKQYGVSRVTFEEHLRKAEGKILKALLPFLEMR